MKKMLRKLNRLYKGITIQLSQWYFSFAPGKVICNICACKANRFESDNWHQYIRCPCCSSEVRHRLLWATLEHVETFNLQTIIAGKKVLHFAPEKKMDALLRAVAGTYKRADYLSKGYYYEGLDYNMDMAAMHPVADASFDCVIACDVLQFLPDHTQGIREAYRILAKGGCLIATVPQQDYLPHTYEDTSITTAAQRKKAFGIYEHLKIFGDDFPSFLEQEGFTVTAIDAHWFAEDLVRRHVLAPPVLSHKPHATNFRKVFIGVK